VATGGTAVALRWHRLWHAVFIERGRSETMIAKRERNPMIASLKASTTTSPVGGIMSQPVTAKQLFRNQQPQRAMQGVPSDVTRTGAPALWKKITVATLFTGLFAAPYLFGLWLWSLL
jgi:hypothetical protein